MKDPNVVIMIGRITKDPELTFTQSGHQVCKTSIANNYSYKTEGENKSHAHFFNLVIWNKGAEIWAQYVKKGMRIYIKGRLQQSSWNDKTTGEKRYSVEIVVEEFFFLSSKKDGASQGSPGPGGQRDEETPPLPDETFEGANVFPEDDIPF